MAKKKKKIKKKAVPAFEYRLVPRCLVEATEAALVSYITPILFLSGPRSGASDHKVKVHLIHETAIALAIFQHVLMHPHLLEHRYDVRWEHQLADSKGDNVPRADLYFSPQGGAGGIKTWIELGDATPRKVRSDGAKLIKYRPKDSLFLLLLELDPPIERKTNQSMYERMLKLAKQKVRKATLSTSPKACRLLTLPLSPLATAKANNPDNTGKVKEPSGPPRIGFGLLKVQPK
jgi:hypothetical protein